MQFLDDDRAYANEYNGGYELKKVVGVRFKNVGKIYHFECTEQLSFEIGQKIIVETSRGIEYATVVIPEKYIQDCELVAPLKPVLRIADINDHIQHKNNIKEAEEAFEICKEKISLHKLDMNLLENEYTFDKSKLIFYFTADGRIDFRELVRDLANIFKTRIELRQIGVRDEAKKLGGHGPCGREYCCKKWLGDFQPVTIKMAKDQGLSLNPSKISGSCGRLFCCLKYENDNYEGIIKRMPTLGSIVETPEGVGKVTSQHTLLEKVTVVIETNDNNVSFKDFNLDEIKVLKMAKIMNDLHDHVSEEELKQLED